MSRSSLLEVVSFLTMHLHFSSMPLVRMLYLHSAANATEESARNASFQMFRNQGPEYFGDLDEVDVDLAKSEEAAAREGT